MVQEVTPEELKEKLDRGENVEVIDIRSKSEFEAGHIPGAKNIPMVDLPRLVDEYDWGAEEVVVACPIGQSSVQAAKLISSYEAVEDADRVKSMKGGYREWTYELETGSGDAEEAEA